MNLRFFDLGLVSLEEGLSIQQELFQMVRERKFPAAAIFCRHYPVITLGRSSDSKKNILVNPALEVVRLNRGGDVTYHGPGQLMFYPVFDLSYFRRDIHWFLRQIEELLILSLADLGLRPGRIKGLTGVWVGKEKISSIGIAIKNWVSYFGAAINVKKPDLKNFSLIRPCGMDIMMTSVESMLLRPVSFAEVTLSIKRRLRNDKSLFT
jgi:lipoate-protein ligase B